MENIAIVRNCPDTTILNSLFFVFMSFCFPFCLFCQMSEESLKSLFVSKSDADAEGQVIELPGHLKEFTEDLRKYKFVDLSKCKCFCNFLHSALRADRRHLVLIGQLYPNFPLTTNFALLYFALQISPPTLLCFTLLCFNLLCFALLCNFALLCFAFLYKSHHQLCFTLLYCALLCFALICIALQISQPTLLYSILLYFREAPS